MAEGRAEVVLFNVSAGIIEKAGNLTVQEIGLLRGVKHEIQKLSKTVSAISAVLLDAEKKQWNSEVKQWLTTLKDPIYKADDLVDDIFTEASRLQQMTRNKTAKEVSIFFSKSNQLVYGHKMGHKVKAVREKLDAVAADRTFYLVDHLEETQVRNRARETHSFVGAEAVIGRENDKKAIIEILLDSNVEENVSILPIVGIGGLGKTTLAQLVFNDEEFKKHFDQKFWVCVSDDFEVRVIVEKIIECAQNEKPINLEMNTLVNELEKEIDGKRYLLVLDDVWNDNHEKWLSLKNILMSGAKGSRILVTIREERVANIVQTMKPYFLRGLSEHEAWLLFKKMAFENGEEPTNPITKSIGMEIIEKCRGVPLAIRSIGSLLYFKNPEKDWLSFKNNELLKAIDILQTLKLSYDHLPSYLKQCFAYCCLFPKDYKIHKITLIKMWMAQGFIRSSSPDQCLEDIGHEYFMYLLWRSFFQEVEKDQRGNILQFKMHDLMHDLAKSIAASDSTISYLQEEDIHEKTRHVSFDKTILSSWGIPFSLYKARRIRTFHLLGHSQNLDKGLDESTCDAIVSSFKFIRLLDLHDMGIESIPSSIEKLRHLRYLDVSYNPLKMLPSSITRLHNLQTLRLFKCVIKELPRNISKLVNLTYIDGNLDLTHMPRGLGQLTKLQTLSQFVMSQNSSLDFKHHGGLKELNGLNRLRGTLEIKGLRHGKEAASESKDSNMKDKIHLQDLTLSWSSIVDESNFGYDEESLVALLPHGPPSNLQELCLFRYGGVKFPSAISSLSNLVKLSLDECNKCQHLPPLDHFHSLKTLHLQEMEDLEYISAERENKGEFSDCSFLPSVEHLTIKFCPNLKGWWQRQRDSVDVFHNHSLPSFPHLSSLQICICPKLMSLPLFPYLEKLELSECSLKPLEQTLRMEVINTATPENLTSIAATSTSSSSSMLAASSLIPLSKLKSMSIENMEETLPKELMCNLISLQDLEICNCCGPLPLSRHLTALQNLTVSGSKEVDFTNNRDEMEWHGLQSLRHLEFSYLPNLATLPVGIQHLTSLQSLRIDTCPSLQMGDLEYISERENKWEFSDSSFLPSLKGWWQRQRDSVEEFHNHSLPSFPHLSYLHIWYCPKLISLPLFPYLEELELRECSLKPLEQTLRMEVINTATPKNLTSIAATSTSSSSTLAASSFIPLSKLKSMSIEDMEETLPKELMCNLISLQDLTIDNCCGPLPLSRHLTALQNLTIRGFKEVDLTNDGDEMEWHGLQSLRFLQFSFLPNLATLPVGIQHLTSLQCLHIQSCPSLSAIPEWICNLTSLQTLTIWECPILSKRCEREVGEDWSKIAHIPHLDIR